MSEREPDLAIGPDVHTGLEPSALPEPNRGEPELVIAPTPGAVAALAAERISAALVAAVERRGRADFCTTGGSTPVPIYRLLARSPICDSIPWSQVHVWWGDDRFVRRGDPESNVTPLDRALLGGDGTGGAPLPPANIHPVPVDEALAGLRDNAWCAARYADEMAAALPIGAGNWPVFDLILVGVGDDGHVLSCFPDSPALDSRAWVMGIPAPTHIGPHLDRVSINPRLLEAAPVLVVTSGQRKSEALGHVFGNVRDGRRWPVQRTRRTGAVWIVDEAAASRIPGPRRG
jgi:6-phosphogluconolactonase